MFCGQCGKEVKKGNKFCTNCGAVIDSGSSINSELSLMIKKAKCVPDYPEGTFADEMDSVKFGKYPQNDVSGKKMDDIEWLVLEKQKDKALLISKYVLDQVPFFSSFIDEEGQVVREDKVEEDEAKWSKSFARKYLNDEFINNAFTENENSMICETKTISMIYKNFHWNQCFSNLAEMENKYKKYDFSCCKEGRDFIGEETTDKVFLINYEDFIKYFGKAFVVKISMSKEKDDGNKDPIFTDDDIENRKAAAKFTKYISEADFSLPQLYPRNNEYDRTKKYRKDIYKGYGIENCEGKEEFVCWFLNSIDYSRKIISEENGDKHEYYRRPIFIDCNGYAMCANPGCCGGYGLRPAIWVKY